MKLSIVIPCYNEGKNVPLLLAEYSRCITTNDLEIIVVDNGSTDGTSKVLAELQPIYPFLRVVTVTQNQGYGFGILSGLNATTGDYIGWTHGDMQTPPENVIKALNIIYTLAGREDVYIKGRRQGRPFFDIVFTWGMTIFETLYLGRWLFDINAQPNVFHRNFYEKWSNPPTDFSLDLYAYYMAKKEHLDLIRFDVKFLRRIHGESHWNKDIKSKWKFIKRTIEFSVKLKKKGVMN